MRLLILNFTVLCLFSSLLVGDPKNVDPHQAILNSRERANPVPPPKTKDSLKQFIADFLTHKIDRSKCIGGFCCRHYTECFCKEFENKVGGSSFGYCDGFALMCYKDGNMIPGSGHKMSIVAMGTKTHLSKQYCIVEPQTNQIVHCWEQPKEGIKTGSPLAIALIPKDARKILHGHLGVGKDCEKLGGTLLYGISDWDFPEFKIERACCECSKAAPNKATDTVRRGPSLACRQVCWNEGLRYLGRTACQ